MFLFDHSNGHDCVAPDALNPTAISKTFGGKQPLMQNSVIANSTYLGPYQHDSKLKVGETQSMIFSHTDTGPFYLHPSERQSQKFDSILGNKTENIPKPDLGKSLKKKGITNLKGNRDKLKKLCDKNKIPTTRTVLDIKQGWANKAKGAYQVLWERGWINPLANPKTYTWKGRADDYGNIDKSTSIKALIMNQPDFLEQKTLLQHHCEQLGVLSDRSPVAHCDIAGKGIEFNWGFSKMNYRSKPIEMKRNKTKFHELVMSVLGKDILTMAVCRANAHRARQYMLAYMTLAKTANVQSYPNEQSTTNEQSPQTDTHNNSSDQTNNSKHNEVTHSLIESCVGLF